MATTIWAGMRRAIPSAAKHRRRRFETRSVVVTVEAEWEDEGFITKALDTLFATYPEWSVDGFVRVENA